MCCLYMYVLFELAIRKHKTMVVIFLSAGMAYCIVSLAQILFIRLFKSQTVIDRGFVQMHQDRTNVRVVSSLDYDLIDCEPYGLQMAA